MKYNDFKKPIFLMTYASWCTPGVLHPYNEEYAISFELNYNAFLNGISLLNNLYYIKEGIVTQKNP